MLSLLNKGWGVSHFVCHLVVMSTSALFSETIPGELERDICSTSQKIGSHCVFE